MNLPIQDHFSLKPHNTFGIEVFAEHFLKVESLDSLKEALAFAEARRLPVLLLGGGSNLVLTQDVKGLVIQLALMGRELVEDSGETVLVQAFAGENWHGFVQWTLEQGFNGLENLSLIPGTVGASPVQNVGAYGVEIKDRMHSLTALDRKTLNLVEMGVADCDFAYRESLFKRDKDRWVILAVRFQLARSERVDLAYGPVRDRLLAEGLGAPTPKDVGRIISMIRSEKLPDPSDLGNAGSFFKNPVVSEDKAHELSQHFENLVQYPLANGQVKLAAGWLIEKAGLKGYRVGDAGVHRLQALVLVNYGNATGKEIMALAEHVKQTVLAQFGVELEIEPNVI